MADTSITPERIDELLVFLPFFEKPDRAFVLRWEGPDASGTGPAEMPYPVYAADVREFFRLATQEWWLDPGYAPARAAQMLAEGRGIDTASIAEVRGMLTHCMREERFGDGYWDGVLRSGRVVALLRRLQVLRGEVAREAALRAAERARAAEAAAAAPQDDGLRVVSPATAEHAGGLGEFPGWRLLDEPELSVALERVSPGAYQMHHVHTRARHFIYVLSGEVVLETYRVFHPLRPGEGIAVPPQCMHRLHNRGAVDAEYLVVSQPSDRGDRMLLREE